MALKCQFNSRHLGAGCQLSVLQNWRTGDRLSLASGLFTTSSSIDFWNRICIWLPVVTGAFSQQFANLHMAAVCKLSSQLLRFKSLSTRNDNWLTDFSTDVWLPVCWLPTHLFFSITASNRFGIRLPVANSEALSSWHVAAFCQSPVYLSLL